MDHFSDTSKAMEGGTGDSLIFLKMDSYNEAYASEKIDASIEREFPTEQQLDFKLDDLLSLYGELMDVEILSKRWNQLL